MSASMSTIDWSRLTHAFGTAVDIPDWIQGAAQGNAEARGWLFRSLYDEGAFFTATPKAVPWLIDLIADRSVPERPLFVAALAEWSNACVGDRLDTLESSLQPDDASAVGTESSTTRQAIETGVPTFLRIATCDTESESLRVGSLHLVASLSERDHAAIEALLRSDQPAKVQAGAILGVGKRGTVHRLDARTRDALASHENRMIRAATSIAVAWDGRSRMTEDAWDQLVETTRVSDLPVLEGWGDLRLCAGARLLERRTDGPLRAQTGLTRALEDAIRPLPEGPADIADDGANDLNIARTLASAFASAVCQLEFEGFLTTAEVATQRDFTPAQRALLEKCGRYDLPIPVETIPYSGVKLTRLARGGGPLERPVTIGKRTAPIWLWLWRMENEETTISAMQTALGSELTPDELIALLGDLWSGSYGEPGMVRADGHPTLQAEAETIVLELLQPYSGELEKELAGRAGVLLAAPDDANIWEARAIVRSAAGKKKLPTIPRYDPEHLAPAWSVLLGRALAAGLESNLVEAIPNPHRSELIGRLGPVGNRYWGLADPVVASHAVIRGLENASSMTLRCFATHRARRFLANLDASTVPSIREAIARTSGTKRTILERTLYGITKPPPFRARLRQQGERVTTSIESPDGLQRVTDLPAAPTLRELQATFGDMRIPAGTSLMIEVQSESPSINSLVQRLAYAARGRFFECSSQSPQSSPD